MNAKTARKVENDNQAAGAAWSKPKNSNGKMIGDRRPSSLKVAQLKARIDHSPRQAVQRKKRDDIQQEAEQRKENKTDIPDKLKSGIKNLSRMDMSDVKVHYNSPKPSQLNAHAYTQGTDIHVASGQEKHLPHEAWHVVQQKQGRVKPTIQMKGVDINDDVPLEKKADVMGAEAGKREDMSASGKGLSKGVNAGAVVQRGGLERKLDPKSSSNKEHKRKVKYVKKAMEQGMKEYDALNAQATNSKKPTKTFYADTDKKRASFVRKFEDGVMKDNSGKIFTTIGAKASTTKGSKPDRHIFAMNEYGEISTGDAKKYYKKHKKGVDRRFHHSSFYAGKGVAGAGEMQSRAGQVELFSDNSGHYKPGSRQMLQVAQELRDQKAGIEKISAEFIPKPTPDDDYMALPIFGGPDMNKTLTTTALEILGYEKERKPELIEDHIREAHDKKDKVMDELRKTFQEAREKHSNKAKTGKETKEKKKENSEISEVIAHLSEKKKERRAKKTDDDDAMDYPQDLLSPPQNMILP